MDGHRAVVTRVTAVAIFVSLTVVALSAVTPLGSVQPLCYVFGGLITGNLTDITVVIVTIGLYILTSSSGAAVPGPYRHIIVPAITTVGLLPIVVLVAFVLRIATVSQRTAATLPFTTSEQEQ